MARKLKIEYVDIDSLRPYENNPRLYGGAIDAVARSIEEFGFRNPIIVDRNGIIIAGHTRWYAARKLGLVQVPIIRADDLTERQVRAFRIADNKTSELAQWDMELLVAELTDLGDDIFTGFTDDELAELLTPAEALDLDNELEDEHEDEGQRAIYRCPKCGFKFEVQV